MGLLDQVLGQVIGGMSGGGAGQGGFGGGRPPMGGPSQSGGMTLPGGLNLPGGLGNLLSGNGGKIAMAVLALLASRHLQNGAGGYGSVLHDMFAGGASRGSADPRGSGDVASQAGGYSQAPAGGSGGFLDQIGGMLGGSAGQPAQQTGSTGGFGGAAGGLGGALGGGVLGSVLGSGLNDLMGRLRQSGHGDTVDSWVGSGPNRGISPGDLEGALGSNQIDDLSRQTGLDRDELLQSLSGTLPHIVDGLTPHGREPSEDETTHWV